MNNESRIMDRNDRDPHYPLSIIHYSRKTRGFSLVEVIVSIGIIVIAAAAAFSVIANRLRYETIVETADIAARDASTAIRAIIADISGASGILASASVAGQTIATSDAAIVFTTPTIDAGGNILATQDTLAFRRNPTRTNELELLTEPAPNSRRRAGIRIAARHVKHLGFRYAHTSPTFTKLVEVVTVSAASFRGRTSCATRGTAVILENAP